MQDIFSERSYEVPHKKSLDKHERRDYLDHNFTDELRDLYADVLGDEEERNAEQNLSASLDKHPEHISHNEQKENILPQQSSVKKFIKKQYPNLSPEKQAILYAAASNPHNIDNFDPEVIQGKVDANNTVASLLDKMGFSKRAQEDTFA